MKKPLAVTALAIMLILIAGSVFADTELSFDGAGWIGIPRAETEQTLSDAGYTVNKEVEATPDSPAYVIWTGSGNPSTVRVYFDEQSLSVRAEILFMNNPEASVSLSDSLTRKWGEPEQCEFQGYTVSSWSGGGFCYDLWASGFNDNKIIALFIAPADNDD